VNIVTFTGSWVILFLNGIGDGCIFFIRIIRTVVSTKLRVKQLFLQAQRIGVDSSTIVILSTLSSGFALALQTYAGLSRVGGTEMLGAIVALGMTRELGPVLTAIMVCSRSGSAIGAELSTMRVTEQIDALRTLRINPFQYLIVPRVVAGTMILPFLTVFGMFFGILGGYLFSLTTVLPSPDTYLINIKNLLTLGDIAGGLIKSAVFGFILTFIGCLKGYRAKGGARAVGYATTSSVVIGCILILISNYFLSVLLYQVGL